MKTFYIWMIAGIFVCTNLTAQRGRGRDGNRGGDFNQERGNPPTMRNQSQSISRDYDLVSITEFPDISGYLGAGERLRERKNNRRYP